jgi:hypothetical protein
MPLNREPILLYVVFGVTVFLASLYFTFPQTRVADPQVRVVSGSKTARTLGSGPAPKIASTSQVISGTEPPRWGSGGAATPAPSVAPTSHRSKHRED